MQRIRLKDFDYSRDGAYAVTICAHRRLALFGRIENEELIPSPAGEIVTSCWHDMPAHFPGVSLDLFALMPNHLHAILFFSQEGMPAACSLPTVIGSFKSSASRIAGRRLWQKSYWERVIRNADELGRLRAYFEANPRNWNINAENWLENVRACPYATSTTAVEHTGELR